MYRFLFIPTTFVMCGCCCGVPSCRSVPTPRPQSTGLDPIPQVPPPVFVLIEEQFPGGVLLGVNWNGNINRQCVGVARSFYRRHYRRQLPFIGNNGAEHFWSPEMENKLRQNGFAKIPNTPNNLPPPGALLIWKSPAPGKNGHIAVVLRVLNISSRTVRVADSNWHVGKYKGAIHDERLDNSVLGWLVPR